MDYEVNDRVKYIHRALSEIDRIYYLLLNKAGMTNSEFVLLYGVLVSGGSCTQKDISENAYISTKTLNSTVKKLEQKGIIELTRGKYPYRNINLTPKGEKYVQETIIPVLELEKRTFSDVSDESFMNFTTFVNKYINMFNENEDVIQ